MSEISDAVLGSYLRGNTDIKALAEEYGVCRERVRQLVAKKEREFKLAKRPFPCVRANGKTFEKTTLREWLAKLHEEMTEMEEKAFGICGLDDYPRKEKLHGTHIETEFALECADVATVLASMQEAFGIDLEARNEAQRMVNDRNRKRGRL